MTAQTTRRALIGGAGLAGVALIAPAIAAVPMPVHATGKWDALVTAFRRADAHMKAIGVEHDAAYKRYQIEADKLGARPVAPDCPRNAYPKPIAQMTLADLRESATGASSEYAAYEAALAD